jgi:DNA-binding NtrC family response regulator
MLTWPRVLLLSSDDSETASWEEMFREHASLRRVRSLEELEATLDGDRYDALFCGWSFHAGTWNQALEQVQQHCPDMPVVVFKGTGDEREWVKVLQAGAFDLLIAPYQKRNVLPVLEQAVISYEARRYHHSDADYRVRAS